MASENNPIPDELLLIQFGFFSPRQLLIMAKVNRQWRRCADDKNIWKRFVVSTVIPNPAVSYKKVFLSSRCYRLSRQPDAEADELLKSYLPLDRDKLIAFLTKYPKQIDYVLFHPDPNVVRFIDNIVLLEIANLDKTKILTIVQHLDTRISIHLNRHLLMHFMDVCPEVTPYILNHPHESVIKEINDKLLIKALEKDSSSRAIILAHKHPHVVRLRAAQVVQDKLAARPADTGCRIS